MQDDNLVKSSSVQKIGAKIPHFVDALPMIKLIKTTKNNDAYDKYDTILMLK